MTAFAHPLGSALMLCLLALSANIAFGEPSPTTQPSPSPALSPEQVVKIVVHALATNDAHDDGIKTTFSFASPENKKVTGPIGHFIPLLKNPLYAPMLNHQSATFRKIAGDANHAQELVTLTAEDGSEAFYVFLLNKQPDGPFKNCWMTDGVQRVQPPEKSPSTEPTFPRDLPDGQYPA